MKGRPGLPDQREWHLRGRGLYRCDAPGNVAAMQGRIAMWHALGEAVSPLNPRAVSSNVFTDPQIASVG